MTDIVHILVAGLPLCGFSRKLPGEWPDDHRWIGLSEEGANCKRCMAFAKIIGDLEWRGPQGKPQNFICLPRDLAVALVGKSYD